MIAWEKEVSDDTDVTTQTKEVSDATAIEGSVDTLEGSE